LPRSRRIGLPRLSLVAGCAFASLLLLGCASHSERTLPVRTALDEGRPREAIEVLDKEMDVDKPSDLPKDIQGDNALFALDRASIQQSLAQWGLAEADFQASDKAIDMLDLARNAGDSIGEYIFSGSSGKYVAPPYEKLLINTLNMIDYLETGDLSGAKIEARRLAVTQKYYQDSLHQPDNPILGLGGFLAGLAFEKSGDADEALRWYDEALQFSGYESLGPAVARLRAMGATYGSPRITAAVTGSGSVPPLGDDEGEIVFVIGYGRVPHKIPKRIPIGLALTLFSNVLSPTNVATANRLAAQGLVTWVSYPTLAPEQGSYAIPSCVHDGRYVQLEEAANVSAQVHKEWENIEGKIVVSAITRMIARAAVGAVIQEADKGWLGLLLSLGTQVTLTALDRPDTRSWETLPARVAIARVRVKAGPHPVRLDVRGVVREESVVVPKGGFALVSLMALR
jgi:hypothetical protein